MLRRSHLVIVLLLCFAATRLCAQAPDADTAKLRAQMLAGEEAYLRNPDSSLKVWLRIDSVIVSRVGIQPDTNYPSLRRLQADVVNNISLIYMDRGVMGAGLEYSFRSFRLREVLNDTHGIAESSNNIAFLYLAETDTTSALKYFRKAQEGYEALRDTGGIAYTLVNQAMIYANRGEDETAFPLYRTAAVYFAGNKKEQRGYATCLSAIGSIYGKRHQLDSALYYSRAALSIRESSDDTKGIAHSYGVIGKIFQSAGMTDSAVHYAKLGYRLALEARSSEAIILNAKFLSDIYLAEKNYEQAFLYYNISVKARDSVTNKQFMNELIRYDLNYQYGKKIAADSTRNAIEQSMLDTELRASRQQGYYLIGILALVAIFAVVMVNRFRVTNRQKVVIEKQKKIVESKQKDILDSMEYATRIQNALLAGKDLLSSKFRDHFVFYRPRDIVSGDFYWATARDGGGKFYLAVCDSTGHGVPGAFMSLLNISFLNEAVSEKRISATGRIFDHVRSRLADALTEEGKDTSGADGMDGVICAFSREMDEVEFSCANNALLIFRKVDGKMEIIESPVDKMPVGRYEGDETAFTTHSSRLQKDDLLLLFTDGYADQFGGEKGKRLMYRRMKEIAQSVADKDCETIRKHLATSFDTWKGDHDQIDDVLVVGIRI